MIEESAYEILDNINSLGSITTNSNKSIHKKH